MIRFDAAGLSAEFDFALTKQGSVYRALCAAKEAVGDAPRFAIYAIFGHLRPVLLGELANDDAGWAVARAWLKLDRHSVGRPGARCEDCGNVVPQAVGHALGLGDGCPDCGGVFA